MKIEGETVVRSVWYVLNVVGKTGCTSVNVVGKTDSTIVRVVDVGKTDLSIVRVVDVEDPVDRSSVNDGVDKNSDGISGISVAYTKFSFRFSSTDETKVDSSTVEGKAELVWKKKDNFTKINREYVFLQRIPHIIF